MLEKISVIVPVYKVEPYLRKCVDSILNQTYRNLEVILVDDGSPDNCGAICDEYAATDARVRVIHKPNGGLSDARNAGMDVMTGAYVAFVDSDDWIEPEHIFSLYAQLQEYADIAVSDVRRLREDGTEMCTFRYQQLEDPVYESVFGYVWNKLYRSSILDGARFRLPFIEDLPFNLQLHGEKKPRYAFTQSVSYNYLLRDGSLLTSSMSPKKIRCFSQFTEELGRTAALCYPDEEARRCCCYFVGNQICNFFCEISSDRQYSVSQKSRIMKELLRVIPDGTLRWKYADHTLLRLLMIVRWLRCPVLFHFAYRMILKCKEGANT